jgi:hypothetical protein
MDWMAFGGKLSLPNRGICLQVKVKLKANLSLKARGGWCYGCTHNIGTNGASGQLHAPSALLCRKAGGPQSRSIRFGEEMYFLPLPGIEPRFIGCHARSVVTILTELHRIHLSADSEEDHRKKPEAGQPIPVPRFEHITFRIQVQSVAAAPSWSADGCTEQGRFTLWPSEL